MRVVIRVDASKRIGTGHVMRCLTLAKSLQKRSVEVVFICRNFKGNLIDYISNKGYLVYVLENSNDKEKSFNLFDFAQEQDAIESKQIIEDIKPKWLIIDHYYIDALWHSTFKKQNIKILVIDDLANRNLNCDVLIDQNYYLKPKERYLGLVSNECKVLLGPKYALLRDEFTNPNLKDKDIKKSQFNIFVFMGGADYYNQTIKVIDALVDLIEEGATFSVDVLVGPINKYAHEIRDICSKFANIDFHINVNNIAELMKKADISIGAGGSVSLERCYLGLPSMVILVADNQIETTESLDAEGALINLGWHENVDKDKIKSTLMGMMQSSESIASMQHKALSIYNSKKNKFGSKYIAELLV
jgi:UDP-2,4-diacetamido-2,4,6-trideoxy-beta-L-altropyranose hydrolase